MDKIYIVLVLTFFNFFSTSLYANSLIDASAKGDTNQVIRLIENGEDINISNKYGYTPLMFAVKKNNSKLVAYLLSKGADKFPKTKDGHSVYNLIDQSTNQSIVLMLNTKKSTIEVEKQDFLLKITTKIKNNEVVNWSDVSRLYAILEKSRSEIINSLPTIRESKK